MVLLEVAKLANTTCVASSVTVFAVSNLFRPTKRVVALAAHAFRVKSISRVRTVGDMFPAYLLWFDLSDCFEAFTDFLCLLNFRCDADVID